MLVEFFDSLGSNGGRDTGLTWGDGDQSGRGGTVNLVACFVAGRIAGLLAARWEGLGWWRDKAPSYKGFRFPVEIISHCVWLYHRFPLSFREVEEMMLQRGIVVSHETIRQWCAKFGQTYTNALRRPM